MADEFKLRAAEPDGTNYREFINFLSASSARRVNQPGMLTFAVADDHPIVALLADDSQVELWRRNQAAGIDWYREFGGFYRNQERAAPSREEGVFVAQCPGYLDLLDRAIIEYYAGKANRSEFSGVAAETVAKTLVTYNATSSGTTGDERDSNVDAWGALISVEADGAGGDTIDLGCSRQLLLPTLQKVAFLGGGDFDLVKTGAQAWEFRWYDGQLGTDKSATVKFSLELGNMENASFKRNRMSEVTRVIVGGKGLDDARVVRVRTGANYHATTNSRTAFYSYTSTDDADLLDAAGDAYLAEQQARDEIRFGVLQTGKLYGRDYVLGDLVTAKYQEIEQTQKIIGVVVNVTGGRTEQDSQITVETGTP